MSSPTIPTFGPLAPSLYALRGIRLWSGEDGAGGGSSSDSGDAGSGSSDSSSSTDSQQGAGSSSSSDTSRSSSSSSSGSGTPKEPETFSREYVSELRTEAANRRKAAEKLAEEKTAAERERDEFRTKLADLERRDVVREIAGDAGGNPRLLLDSDRFRRTLANVDLSKPEDVKTAISDFVQANPEYAATRAGSSGPGRPGGSQTGKPDTSNNLSGAIASALA